MTTPSICLASAIHTAITTTPMETIARFPELQPHRDLLVELVRLEGRRARLEDEQRTICREIDALNRKLQEALK